MKKLIEEIEQLYGRGVLVSSEHFDVVTEPSGHQRVFLNQRVLDALDVSGPSNACAALDLFWPTYDRILAPFGRNYCLRNIALDFNQDTGAITNYEVWQLLPANLHRPEDVLIPIVDWWFTPSEAAVREILAIARPIFDPPPPFTGSLHITMSLEMHRAVTHIGRDRAPVDAEEDSIPKVLVICYATL